MTSPTNRHLIILVSGVYLVADALFATSLAWASATIVLLGCAGGFLALLPRGPNAESSFVGKPIDWTLLTICGVAMLASCLIAGAMHIFYVNNDWLVRDAVLADMASHPPPIAYAYQGGEYLLRAPVGMYVLPGLVGRAGGLVAAHWALLAQNILLLGAPVYVIASLTARRRTAAVALFLAFGGMHILPQLLGVMTGGVVPLWPPRHLNWWNPLFQYSSMMTLIFWVPNHAAPGWWFAALAALAFRREFDVARLGVMMAAMVLWSPLAMIAAPPIMLYLLARDRFRDCLNPLLWICGVIALLFAPVALYLTTAPETVPGKFLWSDPEFWYYYPRFLVVEIPHVALVYARWKYLDKTMRGLAVLSIALLLLIPFYALGPSNDFAMRVSIVPLALLAFVFVSIVVDIDWSGKRDLALLTCGIVILSACTPAFEIIRGFYYPRFAISDCSLTQATDDIIEGAIPFNYVAQIDRVPAWLMAPVPAREPVAFTPKACWPDHPLFHKKKD
jgi:hypothetical protein